MNRIGLSCLLGSMLFISACGPSSTPAARSDAALREAGPERNPPPAAGSSAGKLDLWMLDAQAATVAYRDKRYDDCAKLYTQAGEHATGRAKADFLYSAGSCEMLVGRRAEALEHFRRAIETHVSYCDDIVNDESLQQSLGSDARWAAIVAFKPACASYLESINSELREIYRDDQADRKTPFEKMDLSAVHSRDVARFARVKLLERENRLRTADDYYHAAMIMQHGEDEASYADASRLALRAVDLDPTFVKARWLAAASKDRFLMARSEPQLYGTQSIKRVDGKWILWAVDKDVTDRDRAVWCVEPLDSAKKAVAKRNVKAP